MTLKTQSFRALVEGELKRKNLTSYEVAPQVGIDRSTLYRWLRGDQRLTDERLERLFAFLHLTVVAK